MSSYNKASFFFFSFLAASVSRGSFCNLDISTVFAHGELDRRTRGSNLSLRLIPFRPPARSPNCLLRCLAGPAASVAAVVVDNSRFSYLSNPIKAAVKLGKFSMLTETLESFLFTVKGFGAFARPSRGY